MNGIGPRALQCLTLALWYHNSQWLTSESKAKGYLKTITTTQQFGFCHFKDSQMPCLQEFNVELPATALCYPLASAKGHQSTKIFALYFLISISLQVSHSPMNFWKERHPPPHCKPENWPRNICSKHPLLLANQLCSVLFYPILSKCLYQRYPFS